jgi:two-component system, LuxR family, response regulator FixJ
VAIRGTVYVIDDDDAVRDSIRLLLECEGFHVLDFASAADFLRRAPQGWQSCILTDIHMPGMTGLELIEEIRRRDPTVPVIAMTGRPDRAVEETVEEADGTLLVKPFRPGELVATISTALRRRLQ